MASPVLRSSDLVEVIASFQEGLPQDLAAVQRLADAVELTPCSPYANCEQTGYLAHVPARFACLPYLEGYPHPTTKLRHHALFVSPRFYDRALALHLSIVDGDMALVERWLRWDASLCTSATLELAAAASQGPILRLLFEQFATLATPKMMDLVAMSGDLVLLRWLHEAGAKCSTAAMDGAAMNGHDDVAVFLHSMRTEGCTIAAATAAAINGHASIVRFLLEQRTEGVNPSLRFQVPHGTHTTRSVRGATHLAAVDLVAARVELTNAALQSLVERAGLAILQHVYVRGYLKKMTKPFLELAVAKQDHAMLRYVLHCINQENLRPFSDDEWLPRDAPKEPSSLEALLAGGDSPFSRWEHCQVMELAAFNGDMASLELLHTSRLRAGSEHAIVYAAYRGHMHVLEWLHQNRRDGCNEDAMALAAARGHFDVVRWLHEVYGVWRTPAALATAVYTGHLAMVTYLLDVPTGGVDRQKKVAKNSGVCAALPERDGYLGSSQGDYVRGSPAHWAASQGHLEILELLVARGYEVLPSAMDAAVENGHLHIVRYLHEGPEQRFCSRRPLVNAILKTHDNTVAYVLSRRCWQLGSDSVDMDLYWLLVATARSGRLDILKLLSDALPIPTTLPARVSERMMIRAASYNHLDMLRHLHEVVGLEWTPLVHEAAMRRGSKKVLRYLQTLGPPATSVYVVDDLTLWQEHYDFILTMETVDGHWRARPMYIR
ncbi:hypothetical protein SDRG_11900 [Saprolegnia diclina VS20]|uniref:Uncharacterized protein n=1 Tax=Saprolegnia diclina (strain VS20) TaxID=1156394 RepID=T0RDI4_SAPDV|nr:hypothetical protein SDRG_11900 [Saprolegnia diclina VS20]EQC30323.1 hypothetical protein SDRG_11900 [Saprolegnia diclina VS20]|eukprot:XP_008616176.1 hypothetical protein SDRG_11900 [Saprolegnia diclina VS20]